MWSNPKGIKNDPWLNDKSQYEQNWGSQFTQTVYFILVPFAFREEAKRILNGVSQPAEFYPEEDRINDTFCLFTRQVKGDHVSPCIVLARDKIPTITGTVEARQFKQTLVVYYCIWDTSNGHFSATERREDLTRPQGNINYSPIELLADIADCAQWEQLIKYCQKQKTLALLKGNSDGLSETPQQSQDRIAQQRRTGILQQYYTGRTP